MTGGLVLPAGAQDVLGSAMMPPGGDVAEARSFFENLISTSDNPAIVKMARESLSKLSRQSAGERSAVVKFADDQQNGAGYRRQFTVSLFQQNNSNSLAVPVVLDRKTMGTFLVDTGSTYTVITPRMAKKLGVTYDANTPRVSIITGNGVIKAPIVTLKSITVGEIEVKNVQVIVQHLGKDVLLGGLLGMNFFKDMDMAVQKDKLVLSFRE
ncbi:MAG: TIGR02281 family clan AA aspartic protease [Candidatus Melainabacteria bacterium]